MLTEFVEAAMGHAGYEKLDTGEYYGEISLCPGVWASEETLEKCRRELREVLEDWLRLKLRDGDKIPVIDEIDLNLQRASRYAPKPFQARDDPQISGAGILRTPFW